MKKILRAVLVAFALLTFATTAFAERMTVSEGADLESIQRLAIGMPLYTPPKGDAPTVNDLMQTIFEASRISKCFILSYDDVASAIKRDKNIDIKQLPVKKAAKVYADNVSKYADAVIVPTVAISSRVTIFFGVYDTKNFDLLCDCQTQGSKRDPASDLLFKDLSEEFFHSYNRAVENQRKDREKVEKQEKDAVKEALKKSKALEKENPDK